MAKSKERKLYKIGYLTQLLGITHRSIRYYDQYGLLPHVKRSSGNVRLFDDEDVALIKKIRKLQREEFLPLDVIRDRLYGKRSGEPSLDKVVITDSTALLSPESLENLPIEVVPLTIHIGDEEYLDGKNINSPELWEKSKGLSVPTSTAPPSEEVFEKIYASYIRKGYKEIYSIHLSSRLSQTVKNAQTAAHRVGDRIKVHVIDSKSTGAGLGLLVKQVAESIQAKHSSGEIEVLISKMIPMVFDIMTVNSLKFLAARDVPTDSFSPTALLNKLLDFKPVMTLKNGELEILACHQTKKEAIDAMFALLEHEIIVRGNYAKQISVIYNYMYGEALDLINRIKQQYHMIPIFMAEGSSVLSAYVGNESIGISII